MEDMKAVGHGMREDIEKLRGQTTLLIRVLTKEVDIILKWRNNAENLQKKISKFNADQFGILHRQEKIYKRALVRLRESAEEFLNQPLELPPLQAMFGSEDSSSTPKNITKLIEKRSADSDPQLGGFLLLLMPNEMKRQYLEQDQFRINGPLGLPGLR